MSKASRIAPMFKRHDQEPEDPKAPAKAQAMPQTVWFLDVDKRRTGQVFRAGIVRGPGTMPGTLNLFVLSDPSLDDEEGLEAHNDVKYVTTAQLENWAPGRKFCCTNMLPSEERVPEARAPRPSRPQPGAREQAASNDRRPRRERPVELEAELPDDSEDSTLDAFLQGGRIKRGGE